MQSSKASKAEHRQLPDPATRPRGTRRRRAAHCWAALKVWSSPDGLRRLACVALHMRSSSTPKSHWLCRNNADLPRTISLEGKFFNMMYNMGILRIASDHSYNRTRPDRPETRGKRRALPLSRSGGPTSSVFVLFSYSEM